MIWNDLCGRLSAGSSPDQVVLVLMCAGSWCDIGMCGVLQSFDLLQGELADNEGGCDREDTPSLQQQDSLAEEADELETRSQLSESNSAQNSDFNNSRGVSCETE